MLGQTTGQNFWCKMGGGVYAVKKVLIPPILARHSASPERVQGVECGSLEGFVETEGPRIDE